MASNVEVSTVDRSRLDRLHELGRLFDSAFVVPGTRFRFGLDGIIGLIPGLGDAVGAAVSGIILVEAARIGASKSVLLRMATNVGLELLVGAIPFAGDLFDVVWKANNRNLALLDRQLAAPAATQRASRWFLVGLGAGLLALVVLAGWLVIRLLDALVAAVN